MRKKSLRHQCIWQIKQQYNRGKHLTSVGKGHSYQKSHGHGAYYHAVWSTRTKTNLISSVTRVSKIVKENDIDIHKIADFNTETVTQIMQAENDAGYSSKTMTDDLLAINHVSVGAGKISEDDIFTKKNINDYAGSEIIEKRDNSWSGQRYKLWTASQWIDRNEDKYERWQDTIDFVRGTGLRRSELDSFSVVKDEDDHPWVVVPSGKGGKTRFADIREDLQDSVLSAIDKDIDDLPTVDSDEREKILDDHDHAEAFVRNNEDTINVPHACPTHIFRADYAQNLVKQYDDENDYSNAEPFVSRRGVEHDADEEHTIGAVTASYGAERDVSVSMGHNRLDVLINYFR